MSIIHQDPQPSEIVRAEPVHRFTITRHVPMPVLVHGKVRNQGGWYHWYMQEARITVNAWNPPDAVSAVNRWMDDHLAELWPNGTSPWRPRQPAKYWEVKAPTDDPIEYDLTRSFKSNGGN